MRIKNKGSRSRKRGRKRPKYQAPHPEHPRTVQNIEDREIHAHHAEAFNSSLRRRRSAFRRKTNTYPKDRKGLQRVLYMHQTIHNFVRAHFTTRQIPAASLGIIEKGFSFDELFKIKYCCYV